MVTPPAALVVRFFSTVVLADEDTVKLDSGAEPPTTPRRRTSPVPAVRVRLRAVPSESMVDRA